MIIEIKTFTDHMFADWTREGMSINERWSADSMKICQLGIDVSFGQKSLTDVSDEYLLV